MNVKTRFAPSPTGDLHIGNIRTALYSWLFARNQKGKFILRIEDTNSEKEDRNSVENIITVMKWLRLDWDEGPYFQSHRLSRYHSIINDMLKHKLAYKCYCSQERLAMLRLKQIRNKEKPKYDGHCRVNFFDSNYISSNSSYSVRFCNPTIGKVSFYDQIRGMITFDNQELDDLIICRANGVPTYNFCVVVDDIDMNITHVIRGEEHINNTPRQINIMKALNSIIPIYAHVPMVLDGTRKKLSKRNDSTISIIKYYEDGFLPEAILNCLVRLGWAYGNQEIFSIEEMKQYFSLDKISKSSSIFNIEKLLWLNHYYIKNLPVNYVVQCLLKYMSLKNIPVNGTEKLKEIVTLFSKRFSTLKEIEFFCVNLYKDFDISEKKTAKKYLVPAMLDLLQCLTVELKNIVHWKVDSIYLVLKGIEMKFSIDLNTIYTTIRVAIIGVSSSPSITVIMYVLGKICVLNRIEQAIAYIQTQEQ